MAGDPPIVITGGSVSITFDPGELTGRDGRFSTQDKQIKRVEVTGDGIDFAEDTPKGEVTIRIHYGDP